jgi:hypothetical protein
MSWDLRQLCDNGACIGVLASDGNCPRCGQASEVSKQYVAPNDVEDSQHDDSRHVAGHNGDDEPEPGIVPSVVQWDDRQLCDNGACIGVMQAGICTTCGLAAQTSADFVNGQRVS